ncbi:hypothetical protein [Joostella sp. CR20]|uniref:hypothetical protein n=1 Tax=Joostella sp. CR20 TaxID=2804312 RepID=UPI00313AE5AB
MSGNERYFNFPIQLLNGFMGDSVGVLQRICDYAVYDHYLKLDQGTKAQKLKAVERYFGMILHNSNNSYAKGEALRRSIPVNSPKVGINRNVWFDYCKNHKTDFEKISLLGFLAIKSIVQNKTYCKVTNRFWLSRMDGLIKSVSKDDELSDEIKKYANRWQLTKIKEELIISWGLVHYSRFTRGFYVSFKLSLEDLIYQAEKKRKSTLIKQKKFEEKVALNRVLDRIKNEPP